MIEGLSIGNYRSFGNPPEHILFTGKLNIIIGKNNAGKSNILRAISFLLPKLSDARASVPWDDAEDKCLYSDEKPTVGLFMSIDEMARQLPSLNTRPVGNDFLKRYFEHCGRLSPAGLWLHRKKDGNAWNYFADDRAHQIAQAAFKGIGVTRAVTQILGTAQPSDPTAANNLAALFNPFKNLRPSALIPANRSLKFLPRQGFSVSDNVLFVNGAPDLGGAGLIERLFVLQNPDFHDKASFRRFRALTEFIRLIIADQSAIVQVPHSKATINLTIDGEILPITSYGSGLEQVLIVAAAATVLENYVICLEEPETDLHPEFQIRLMNFLRDKTDSNQYFVSTHSHSIIDLDRTSLYAVKKESKLSHVIQLTKPSEKYETVFDLGYRPSDIAQCNCVVWVEGPSDRIYLREALLKSHLEFVEGIDFSIMFYGGRLLSHLSADDEQIDGFIVLTELNRRSSILIDSDKTSDTSPLNATKSRVTGEFAAKGLFAWVTEGREIENYVSEQDLLRAVKELSPTVNISTGKFDDICSALNSDGKKINLDKVKLAHKLTAISGAIRFRFDWNQRLTELAAFIQASN